MTIQNKLDELTERHIESMKKILIDSIFSAGPLWAFRKGKDFIDDDPSDFETWAREVRADAGIIDPPRKRVFGGGRITDYDWDFYGNNYATYGKLLDSGGLKPEDFDSTLSQTEDIDKK